MEETGTFEEISERRRSFLGTAASVFAAAQLGSIGAAAAQINNLRPPVLPAIKPGTNTAFASLKQILEGDANGAPHPEPASYAKKFSGRYSHRTIKGGIGHNLPQEAPQAFAEAVVDVAAG